MNRLPAPLLALTPLLALALQLVALSAPAAGQGGVGWDPERVRAAVVLARSKLEASETAWRARLLEVGAVESNQRELFGYNPPGSAVGLAFVHACLYEEEGDPADARQAAEDLLRMARYRQEVPPALFAERPEYGEGLPAVPSFFQLADYADAWRMVRGCPDLGPDLGPEQQAEIDEAVRGSANFIFVFPEWGAHNRAMLRAESLIQAARALPEDADAARWRQMAAILAQDSFRRWEIEDAQSYHPIWTWAVMQYADAAGRDDWYDTHAFRASLRYLLELLTPAGNLPAFGDGWWNRGNERLVLCFERAAAQLADPELKWAAQRVYEALPAEDPAQPSMLHARLRCRLRGRCDPELPLREPAVRSGPVLDELMGKKLVLRDGWGPRSSYLALNFRDEGSFGRLDRDFLRQTLAVEEEKMHHGHEDENSIVLWMHDGSVLLHDAGYRDFLPSGKYGAYRSDLFHNRLLVRSGRRDRGQPLLEFLRDSGAYDPVRTELIDFVDFQHAQYSRTRISDPEHRVEADRVLLRLPGESLLVVVDVVRALDDGYRTLAPLWATQQIVEHGQGWARGRTRSIENVEFEGRYDLLMVLPQAVGARGASAASGGTNEGLSGDLLEQFDLSRHRQPERVCTRAVSRWFAAGSTTLLVSVLWPLRPEESAEDLAQRVSIGACSSDEGVCIRLRGRKAEWTVGIQGDLRRGLLAEDLRPRYDPRRGSVQYGALRSDADLVLLREGAESDWWAATNMTHVEVRGESWMASTPSAFFQTSGRSDHVGRAKWRRWEEER